MPASLSVAEFYRREATRLRAMAQSPTFRDVAPQLLIMAEQCDRLASQAQAIDRWSAGTPGRRRD